VRLAALAAALTLEGCSCGNGPCQHLATAEAGLKAKAGDCSLSFVPFDEKKCESKSGDCTNDDYMLIDSAATCLEGIGTCSSLSQQTWLQDVLACAPPVSAACEPAVSQ